jgi:uncharacterized protein YbbC (DUF1343 family)
VELMVGVRKTQSRFLQVSASALDKDWGTDTLRKGLEDGLDVDEILARWEPQTHAFESMRERYLLYA